MTNFQPVNSNPADGELITLCKILESVSTGGGGGDSDVAVGADGVTRVPLNVNAAGELKVNVEASIDADLADIENALATTNGILTTTAADTATIKDEAISIDGKLPALSSGRVPVEANNAASQVFTNTVTGVLSGGTIFLGPIDCSQFRQIIFHATSMGTGMQFVPEISLDGTVYVTAAFYNSSSAAIIATPFSNGSYSSNLFFCPTYGAKWWRLRASTGASGGTTTATAYATQSPANTPTSSNVTGSVTVAFGLCTPSTSSGAGFSTYHTLISAATTNATSVRASAGTIGTCVLTNTSLTFKYVKFFNLAVAPTMGTSTPVIQFPIAPNSTLEVSTAFAGLRLATGIAYAITGGSALLDTTAVGAGEVLVNLSYA